MYSVLNSYSISEKIEKEKVTADYIQMLIIKTTMGSPS